MTEKNTSHGAQTERLSMLSDFSVVLSRRGRALVLTATGVIGVDAVCDSSAILRMKDISVCALGERLIFNVYEGGVAEVVGKISAVELKYGKT